MKKGKGRNSKMLPNSFRIISSCIKTVSTNASTVVRSAGASVAASISSSSDASKDQVLWAGFDKLEIAPTSFRRVLLLGYENGFQVFDIEDDSSITELVSKRDGAATFLQMLPLPAKRDVNDKYRSLHPILVVVMGDDDDRSVLVQNVRYAPPRYGSPHAQSGCSVNLPKAVRFYSIRSNEYEKVVNFKSAVLMVRCSPRIVAVGLEKEIHCIDSFTLEMKFSVLTYPVPRFGEQGAVGIGTGYGPMAVGPRWLAYPPNHPFVSNTGRLSPKNLASAVSPSTSPGSGSMMARYAMESSKQLAAGILTLGDMGYKKLSKYCPELLPDGSSSPGWKGGKLSALGSENAGTVVIKDAVSMEIVSQFMAHTSPISALCFDPSGTLLVTASVHGHNINVFRIMPSSSRCGSGYDWSNSHVHLYKLYRGMTTAIIQDICFSNYSQWIAIVSSKGTCHIFLISPFGGEAGFQALRSPGNETSVYPVSSHPWWSTSSFTMKEQYSLPPSPCTLHVVNRIKNDSGLLNSVSDAAASMVGKSLPSGAVAAVFHSFNDGDTPTLKTSSLEHLLVYAPSGFVVLYILQSTTGVELSESIAKTWSIPQVHPENEELRVSVQPRREWDVVRRSCSLEREESISLSMFSGYSPDIDDDTQSLVQENERSGQKKLVKSNSLKSSERTPWYFSNAEVQVNSCRLQIWRNSKIHFHVMKAPKGECYSCGEFEIEMVSSNEVEIKQKDLLPIFDHFHSMRTSSIDRGLPDGRYSNDMPLDSCQAREKGNEETFICHSEPPSFSSTESSEGGSSRRIENLHDLDHINSDRSPVLVSRSLNELERGGSNKSSLLEQRSEFTPGMLEHLRSFDFLADNTTIGRDMNMPKADAIRLAEGIPTKVPLYSGTKNIIDLEKLSLESYCDNPELSHRHQSTEILTDEVGSDVIPCEKENPDDTEWHGGMFDFSD